MGNHLDRMKDEKIYQFVWWPRNVRPNTTDDEYWDSMIHPDDLSLIENGVFHGNIFKEIESDIHYLTISDGENELRINQLKKSKCLKEVDFEGFFYKDLVTVNSNNGENTVRNGRISYLFYHNKDNCIIYQIDDPNGKRVKKQYKSKDLKLK